MYYDAVKNDHTLPHDPFKALVGPRPIGWISSVGKDGSVNLAPYSFFNAVASRPHLVMFSSQGRKDSLLNIEETGAFVCNMASYALRDAMNATSAPVEREVNEFELAGLTMADSVSVPVPRVAEAPAALECRYLQTVPLTVLSGESAEHWMVIGQVTGIHIDDAYLKDGLVDSEKMQLLARLGYMDYSTVDRVFSLNRPQN
ncbi:flavin reductase family protein [Coralliovum pocilloporae]|uniref:flavin reductase family protein n=1 Tax=Coralliovum pocilloporae TaxID=3066369 RepID=UPI003306A4E5